MIEIKELSFAYPGSKHRVFSGLSLTLEGGKIYGLLGKNGEGKSTLLYLMAGLMRAWGGSITVDGWKSEERRPEMLQELFIVPEEYDLPRVSMSRFIAMNRDFYPRFSTEVLHRCLSEFGMPTEPNLKALSMGQKKKVYMSFALAAGTKYLLMDEPTNGLDIPSKSLFRKVVLSNMTDERTIIISTHQVHDVEQLLDHIILLDKSQAKLNESVSALTERYSFELRQPAEMDHTVIYAEPSLQGNAVIARRQPGSEETSVNLELLFNAVTKGLLKE